MRNLSIAILLATATMGAAAEEAVVAPNAVVFTAEGKIDDPLWTGRPNGYRGVKTFIDEARGDCLACHTNFDTMGTGRAGDVGPVLSVVGDKHDPARLRAILVDPTQVFGEETPMPAFYVADSEGETLLTAQEIEDIIAYLGELHRYLK